VRISETEEGSDILQSKPQFCHYNALVLLSFIILPYKTLALSAGYMFYQLKKVSQSSRLASREKSEIRFLRRRVRRKKHFARRECILACMARQNARFGANLLSSKRPTAFLMKLFSELCPTGDDTGAARLVHVDDALVTAAAELEGDVLQLLAEAPVDEHVDAVEHCVRHLAARVAAIPLQLVVETVAREAPDGLLRIPRTHLSQQRQQIPLVLRFKRLTAEDGQPADIGFVELGENLVRRRLREGLAVVEVPRLRLEAAGTVVAAAGDEERHPHADAVGDVAFFQFSVVHGMTSFRFEGV